MTLPVYPNTITIDNLRTQTSNTTGSLAAYYAGAGIIPPGAVGAPGGVNTPIPSSGTISLDNFHGYPVGGSANAIINWWWNNRSALYRASGTTNFVGQGNNAHASPSTWPTDALNEANWYTTYSSLQGTLTWTFGIPADTSTIYSQYWTYITCGTSHNAAYGTYFPQVHSPTGLSNIVSDTGTTDGTVNTQFNSYRVTVVRSFTASPPPIVVQPVQWSNWDGSSNLGGTFTCIAIPGWWQVANTQTASGLTSFTIPAGQFSIFQSYSGAAMTGYTSSNANRFYANNTRNVKSTVLHHMNITSSPLAVTQSTQVTSPAGLRTMATFFSLLQA